MASWWFWCIAKKAWIAVLRAEDATIKEIGFMPGDLLDGIALPRGSVVLVSSVSDLGRQGLVVYCEDLAKTIRIAKEKQGKGAQVVALPPVLLGGLNSYRLLRNVVEAKLWAKRLEGGGGNGVLL
jgi:hypothetical protein